MKTKKETNLANRIAAEILHEFGGMLPENLDIHREIQFYGLSNNDANRIEMLVISALHKNKN